MTLIRYFYQGVSRLERGYRKAQHPDVRSGLAARTAGGSRSPATSAYPVIVGGLQYGQGCSPARSASRTVSSRPLLWVRQTLVAW